MRRYRFWLWLLAFVRGKCCDAYVAAGATNIRCPACHTWTAETGGPLRACEMADFTVVTCRQCGVSNSWCLDAPIPYRPERPEAEESK